MNVRSVSLRRVGHEDFEVLAHLFDALRENGDEAFFHPHPLTREHATTIAEYEGADQYLLAWRSDRAVAYGLLRGWDEGYETPSLGIAVHPAVRGQGIGATVMGALHDVCRDQGASTVRLTVDERNVGATRLYEVFGYSFERRSDGVLVGLLVLDTDPAPAQVQRVPAR